MKKWAVLFGALILAIIVLADTGRLGWLGWAYGFPGGDKIGHFMLFGLLSLLVNMAAFEIRQQEDRVRLAVRASVALASLIALEEFSQRWFPLRTSSVWDLTASLLGVAFFARVAVEIETRRRKVAKE